MALINSIAPQQTSKQAQKMAANNQQFGYTPKQTVAPAPVNQQGMSVDPNRRMSVAPGGNPYNNPNSTMGVQAKNPSQNVKKTTNTLTPADTKPITFTDEQNKGLLAALARQQNSSYKTPAEKTNDEKNLAYAKAHGWSAPASQLTQNRGAQAVGQGIYVGQTGTGQTGQQEAQKKPDASTAGILQGLVNASNKGSDATATAQENIFNLSKENPALSGPAYEDLQKTKNKLLELDNEYARQKALLSNAPISLEFKQGREQVLDTQYSAQRAALTQAINTAQQAVGQQIAGVQAQQAGNQAAGGLGISAVQTQQAGLTSAGQLAQPIQAQFGTGLITRDENGNLVQGAMGGNTAANPLSQVSTIAQQVLSGQISPSQAFAMGGTVANWSSLLNAELLRQDPNYNYAKLEGSYGATQQVTGGQAAQVENWKSALQQGQNLQAQLVDLIKTVGINPNDVNAANRAIQTIASQTSNPHYQTFMNLVADIANTYAQVLTPANGNMTDKTREISQSLINSSMSGNGIIAVMGNLDEAAKAKIAGVGTAGGIGTTKSTTGTNWNW